MGVKYPQTVATWERAWERFTPLPGLPSDAQACHLSPTSWEVPPTNTIEAASYQLRKVSKNRGHFPFR